MFDRFEVASVIAYKPWWLCIFIERHKDDNNVISKMILIFLMVLKYYID